MSFLLETQKSIDTDWKITWKVTKGNYLLYYVKINLWLDKSIHFVFWMPNITYHIATQCIPVVCTLTKLIQNLNLLFMFVLLKVDMSRHGTLKHGWSNARMWHVPPLKTPITNHCCLWEGKTWYLPPPRCQNKSSQSINSARMFDFTSVDKDLFTRNPLKLDIQKWNFLFLLTPIPPLLLPWGGRGSGGKARLILSVLYS